MLRSSCAASMRYVSTSTANHTASSPTTVARHGEHRTPMNDLDRPPEVHEGSRCSRRGPVPFMGPALALPNSFLWPAQDGWRVLPRFSAGSPGRESCDLLNVPADPTNHLTRLATALLGSSRGRRRVRVGIQTTSNRT